MKACETTVPLTALANAIAASLIEDEVTYLAAIFAQLGETLATIAVCRGLANREEEEKK